jgi:uncharacterized protein (TIGR02246 family)
MKGFQSMRSILTMAGLALALVAMAFAQGPQKTLSGDSPAKPSAATAASAPGPAHSQDEQSIRLAGGAFAQGPQKTLSGDSLSKPGTATAATAPANQQDEQSIRLAAEAFAKAYNAGDARTIAQLFVADGEIVSEEGQSTQGREAIEQVFAEIFKEHPKSHMDLAVGSIRFIGTDMAVEEGMATVIHGPGEPAQRSPYSVVHASQNGKWLTASARDLRDDTPAPEEQLKQLQWMIGEWVDESPEALVMTSYRWTDNQCYILSEFKVQIGGRPVMTGTQRIGWDPLAKNIRSWVFDSEGGFGEGIWTPEGNQWIVKRTGVTRDGKIASATNIITRVCKDRMTWQQRDRIVGGEKTPDIAEIPITRKPPLPK